VITKAQAARVYWDLNSLREIKRTEDAVKEFEAYLLHLFLKEAEKATPKGLFNTSFQYSMYKDLLYMQIAQELAAKDPLNLEDAIGKAVEAYSKNSIG